MDSHAALRGRPAPRRVSQDPPPFCRRAPSPITPGGSAGAAARCFPTDSRLRHLREVDHRHWCHEAESGSLALGSRLCSRHGPPLRARQPACRTDPFRALGHPRTPGRSYMLNEQFTWLTPHSQQERVGLPWRTEEHEGAEATEARGVRLPAHGWPYLRAFVLFVPSCLRRGVARICWRVRL